MLMLFAAALGITTPNLALPVLPLAVAGVTGTGQVAGVVTAAVAALTITTELLTPRLIARVRPVPLLLAGLLFEMLAMAGFAEIRTLASMLVFGGMLGAAFGVVATVSTILVGSLAPAGRRGEAIGYYGLAASVPTVVGGPAGLLLLHAFGLSSVFLAGAATALGGLLVALLLRPGREVAPARPTGGSIATLTAPRVLLVWGSFVCVTFTFGGVVSFSPLLLPGTAFGAAPTFLLCAGLARTATRTLSGRVIDRLGDWRPVWPLLLVGALGLALLPLRQPALTVLAAVLFGAGLGVAQTSTFIGMLRSTDPSRAGIVSGLWNMGVDVGILTSALLLAPLAAAIGYQAMFWTLPVLFLAALAARGLERRLDAG